MNVSDVYFLYTRLALCEEDPLGLNSVGAAGNSEKVKVLPWTGVNRVDRTRCHW